MKEITTKDMKLRKKEKRFSHEFTQIHTNKEKVNVVIPAKAGNQVKSKKNVL